MQEIIPLFPLDLVVFPGQEVQLHIFESRYQKLVEDCWHNKATFGVQPVIEDRVQSTGTEVEITRIDNRYAGGKMDITVKGKRIYKLLNYRESIHKESYANGVIGFLSNKAGHNPKTQERLMTCLRKFDQLLSQSHQRIQRSFSNLITNYELVNKVGLSLKKQYLLLANPSENERKKMLLNHCHQQFAIEKQASTLTDRIVDN